MRSRFYVGIGAALVGGAAFFSITALGADITATRRVIDASDGAGINLQLPPTSSGAARLQPASQAGANTQQANGQAQSGAASNDPSTFGLVQFPGARDARTTQSPATAQPLARATNVATRAAATTRPRSAATAQPPRNAYPIQPDNAARIAAGVAPGALVQRTSAVINFQGLAVYAVSLDRGMVYVNANSGAVVYNSIAPAQPVQPSPANIAPNSQPANVAPSAPPASDDRSGKSGGGNSGSGSSNSGSGSGNSGSGNSGSGGGDSDDDDD